MSSQTELQRVHIRTQSQTAQIVAEPAILLQQDIDEALQDGNGTLQQKLPPADGGAAAWRLLGAAFIFEALLWGNSQ